MKIRDFSFLTKAFDREDLYNFYEVLEHKLSQFAAKETTENTLITGYIVRVIMLAIEKMAPKYHRVTFISRTERREFRELIRKRLDELNIKRGKTLSVQEREQIQLSMMTLKFMYTLSKQDDLFN